MKTETVIQLETNIDHLTGEEIGQALCSLNELPQILDALYIPGIGKKNRPAGLLQVLCIPENEACAVEAIFRHTHTLGIRRMPVQRYALKRHVGTAECQGAAIPAKFYELENREYCRPEADSMRQLAKDLKLGAPALRLGVKKPE